jgi:hypothetical protein
LNQNNFIVNEYENYLESEISHLNSKGGILINLSSERMIQLEIHAVEFGTW